MLSLAALALGALKRSFGQRLFRHHHPKRNAQKVAVGKLFPGAQVTVVPQHLYTGLCQSAIKLAGFGGHFLVAARELNYMYGKRSYKLWPHYTPFVRKKLYNGTHGACRADTIGAHYNLYLLARIVFIGKPQWG